MTTQNRTDATDTNDLVPAGERGRLGLVTGASGYVGGQLVTELLDRGWRVRVLTRRRSGLDDVSWAGKIVDGSAGPGEVEVVEGDATDEADLKQALRGTDAAWYLLHSMGDVDDFQQAERDMASAFANAAKHAGTKRIVYLGGLHPEGEELSEHLESRAEVGDILMASGVPTAALQAGIVIGDGSVSFTMLRDLAERLPIMFGPAWLKNEITPIAVNDLVHYLARAADLPASINRTFDVGGTDTMPYADLIDAYAQAMGIGRRPSFTLPVMSPNGASAWISLTTSVPYDVAHPIVESILHDTVVKERDIQKLLGDPAGGPRDFRTAVLEASRDRDAKRWMRTLGVALGGAAIGAAVTIVGRRAWEPVAELLPSGADDVARFAPAADVLVHGADAVVTALAVDDLVHEDAGSVRDAVAAAGVFAVAATAVASLPGRGWASVALHTVAAGAHANLARLVGGTNPVRGLLTVPGALWNAARATGSIVALRGGTR